MPQTCGSEPAREGGVSDVPRRLHRWQASSHRGCGVRNSFGMTLNLWERACSRRRHVRRTHFGSLNTSAGKPQARMVRRPLWVVLDLGHGYSLWVAANSATGFDRPNRSWHASAAIRTVGTFFVSAVLIYGGCAWGTFVCAGFLDPRSVNPRTAATHSCLTAGSGSSI